MHVNHDLDDVHLLNEVLVGSGLSVEYIPIAYRRSARADGLKATDHMVDSLQSAIERSPRSRRLCVIEDGGFSSMLPDVSDLAFVVEQTSKGSLAHHEASPRLPVLSVPRSSLKCRVESTGLGIRLADELSSLVAVFRNVSTRISSADSGLGYSRSSARHPPQRRLRLSRQRVRHGRIRSRSSRARRDFP